MRSTARNSPRPLSTREVPVVVFDRIRGLQAKREIILQHSLSFAMLDWNSFWSGTELSHTKHKKVNFTALCVVCFLAGCCIKRLFDRLKVDDPPFKPDHGGVCAVVGVQLGEDVSDLALDGVFGHRELRPYLF